MIELNNIEYIIIHHTDRNIDCPLFVRARHIFLRGWDDIGYHYLIGNGLLTVQGRVYQGRPEVYQGAHALSYNQNSLGISLVGDFDNNKPGNEQMQVLYSLLVKKMLQYKVPLQNILGHRELKNVTKSCPGRLIDMEEIREVIKKKM